MRNFYFKKCHLILRYSIFVGQSLRAAVARRITLSPTN
ncbi:hypothetical protein CPter91_2294 [Collimonas pratensis]|uniref:Uncharacterized protein n=1 Tax=Collimonas pratensis TaxID=279113 RepID=A0A127Q3R0_9BURK|nr:hypothetical protein CPter91_2294 [Collimonas pratensis]